MDDSVFLHFFFTEKIIMQKYPITPAIRWIRSKKISFEPYLYTYKEKGGAKWAAISLNLDVHHIIKTIVLEDEKQNPFIVLMHGDYEVSIKKIARAISCKSVILCSPQKVKKITGYLVGGCSPFGTKVSLPLYCEKTIGEFSDIWLNAGKRGFLVKIAVTDIKDLWTPVSCAIQK